MKSIAFACAGVLAFGVSPSVLAQPAPPTEPLQVSSPRYNSVLAKIQVDRPIAQVWGRVGKFCDIGEWASFPCQLTAGRDGELGAVRSVGAEILVGKTQYSYTYTQPVRVGAIYNIYHGTLEARAVGPNTTTLFYSLFWDNSMIPEGARPADVANRQHLIDRWLANMKALAEGGALPPPSPRPAAQSAPAARPAR